MYGTSRLALLALLTLVTVQSLHAQEDESIIRLLPPPSPESLSSPPETSTIDSIGEPPAMQPVWYNPYSWIGPRLWEGTVEVGINGAEGNAQSFSMRTGGNLTRQTDRTKTVVDITYAKTQANSIETQHNALLDARIDRNAGESPWSLFKRFGLEYDEFKTFNLRVRLSGGVGYAFIQNDVAKFVGRLGAGSSREIGGVDDQWVPEANFGMDYELQITERQKFDATVDYYPAWEDFTDYRLVTDLGWEVLLDEASNLSLKVGVIDRYDSTPNGARPNDLDYSILLLWKL